MPAVKSVLAKTTFCVLAATFALTGYSYLDNAGEKNTLLYKSITHTSKLKAPLTIRINNLEDAPIVSEKVYDIEAVIQSPQNFENLTWEWIAPAGVDLLDRSSGRSLNIGNEDELKMRMRFRQTGDANHQIRLVLKDPVSGAIVGRGRFNTTKQREMASETDEIMKRQEEYLEENSEVLNKTKKPKHTH
jgi:hypothetical protein